MAELTLQFLSRYYQRLLNFVIICVCVLNVIICSGHSASKWFKWEHGWTGLEAKPLWWQTVRFRVNSLPPPFPSQIYPLQLFFQFLYEHTSRRNPMQGWVGGERVVVQTLQSIAILQYYNCTRWNIFFFRWFLVVRSIKWAKWEKMSAESRFYTHVMMWPLSNTRILRWLSVMANIVTSPIAQGLNTCMSWFSGRLLRLPFIVVLSLHCKSGLQY